MFQFGVDFYFMIDVMLQYIVESEFEECVKWVGVKGGLVILFDLKDFVIFVIVLYFGFDFVCFGDVLNSQWCNCVVFDFFEFGLIFKMVIVVVVIEGGVVYLDDCFDCGNGGIWFGCIYICDYKFFDVLSFCEIIVKLSNVGVIKVVFEIGFEWFYEMIQCFGFGCVIGVDLLGEYLGFVYLVEWWDCGNGIVYIFFGYFLMVMLIQVVNVYVVFVNGGVMNQLYFVCVVCCDGMFEECECFEGKCIFSCVMMFELICLFEGVVVKGGLVMCVLIDGY